MSPQQQQQRAESPPYVTSDANQSMEAYQEAFWQRQLARVEEQVTLPEEQMAAITAARERSAADTAAASSSTSAEGAEMLTEQQNFSDADLATTAKALMELFKPQAGQLPLARIKKVMKASDDDVKMISAEAPILFARACEIFIADLTCRSYMHATANRRRTVQHSDVVAAVAGSNLFDFLVDIVPRSSGEGVGGGSGGATVAGGSTKATSQRGSGRTTDEEFGAEEVDQPLDQHYVQ